MSIENEEEIQEEEKEATNEPVNKISRARNRTVMLTPEMTGQVRNAFREEKKEVVDPEFSRPNGINNKLPEPPKAPLLNSESSEQSNVGFKFGKSSNRSKTTKISREEIEKVIKPGAAPEPVKHESADGFNLPNPPKAFDPMTSVVPPTFGGANSGTNFGNSGVSRAAENNMLPRAAQQVEPRQQQNQPPLMQKPLLQPNTPVVRSQVSTGTTKIVGFLVSFDQDQNGEVYEIRAGRKLITSRPTDHGEYLLIEHATISPLHAILRTTKDGTLQVLDQLSEHGTGITRSGEQEEIEVAGGLEVVQNGDTLRFGERSFQVCLLPSNPKVTEK